MTLIKREDAIEAIKKEIQDFEANCMHGEDDENYGHDIGFVAGLHRAKTFIRSLPSAGASQNLTEPNKSCEVDLISRADAIEAVCRTRCGDKAKGCPAHSCLVIEEFDALLSAEAPPYCVLGSRPPFREPKTWHEKNSHTYICGDCGFEQAIYGNIDEYNCCPRCGVYKEYVDYGCIFPQKRTPYREDGEE